MDKNKQWIDLIVELQSLAQAGLTYGKELSDAVEIGTKLAASVITSSENVCPRFLPRELGLDMDVSDC